MVHFTTMLGIILAMIGVVAVLAIVFSHIAERKGRISKAPKVLSVVIMVLMVLFIGIAIINSSLRDGAEVVDVEYTSSHTVVETENLVIKEERALTIISDDGRVIGIYPTKLVKNMFDLDETGHIVPDVGSVNLTIWSNKPVRAVDICGIWFVASSSAEWVTSVILD